MTRGDVVLVRFPHPSGLRGKKWPAVVVRSDAYVATPKTLVVAEITKNRTMASDPACLLIDAGTPEGKATGLVRDSVVSCLVLVAVSADTVETKLGTRSAPVPQRLDASRKAALGLPSAPPNNRRKRTGAAIPVVRGSTSLPAAPAA